MSQPVYCKGEEIVDCHAFSCIPRWGSLKVVLPGGGEQTRTTLDELSAGGWELRTMVLSEYPRGREWDIYLQRVKQ